MSLRASLLAALLVPGASSFAAEPAVVEVPTDDASPTQCYTSLTPAAPSVVLPSLRVRKHKVEVSRCLLVIPAIRSQVGEPFSLYALLVIA